MGATRFGFGSMGAMFGRGGFRGGRGNSGGWEPRGLVLDRWERCLVVVASEADVATPGDGSHEVWFWIDGSDVWSWWLPRRTWQLRGMGATRFGFGSMGAMFGRGGFRGGRG